MRIILLALTIFACQDHEFGARIDIIEPNTAEITPTPNTEDAEKKPTCAKSCKVAVCQVWGDWQVQNPNDKNECMHKQIPVTEKSIRTCSSSNACQNLTCKQLTETKKEEVSGKNIEGDCRVCQTSCEAGCERLALW